MIIIKHLKKIAILCLAATLACFSLTVPVSAAADPCDAPEEIQAINGCKDTDDNFASTITGILNAIIGIAGLVAVIFIIVGGINYMTSAGDTAKLQKGKNTIIYALIGLVICALSFAIVNWVIVKALGNGSEDKNKTSYIITEQISLAK